MIPVPWVVGDPAMLCKAVGRLQRLAGAASMLLVAGGMGGVGGFRGIYWGDLFSVCSQGRPVVEGRFSLRVCMCCVVRTDVELGGFSSTARITGMLRLVVCTWLLYGWCVGDFRGLPMVGGSACGLLDGGIRHLWKMRFHELCWHDLADVLCTLVQPCFMNVVGEEHLELRFHRRMDLGG